MDVHLDDLRQVDRFDLVEILGKGGFGVVFRARHRIVGNEVALKVMRPRHEGTSEHTKRFLREARGLAALSHPNIVRVLDAGRDRATGVLFIAMELLQGRNLAQERRSRGPLPASIVREIGVQLLAGLGAAHRAGIVHRDLKPSNIIALGTPADAIQIKIVDFGVRRSLNETTMTDAGALIGTPRYMSPEQVRAERVDHRADIFAAGAILHELASGRPLYEAEADGVLRERLHKPKPPSILERRADFPRDIADVIDRAVALDPDARWADADEMRAALGGGATGPAASSTLMATPSLAPPPGPHSLLPPPAAHSLAPPAPMPAAPASNANSPVPIIAGALAGLFVVALVGAAALWALIALFS